MRLTDAESADVSRGAVDSAQLFPPLPPPVVHALGAESQQQEEGIPCKIRQSRASVFSLVWFAVFTTS